MLFNFRIMYSCVENTGVPDNHDLLGNMEEEDCTASEANTPKPLFDPAWFKANREVQ